MMKIKQNMDLLLWIRRSQTKNDVAPLYIRVTIDGISKEISLGVKINPKDWDIKSKRVKKTEPSYKTTNSKIIQAQVDLDRHFNALKTQVDRVTPDMVKNAYLGKSEAKANTEKSEKGKDTILYAFDEFILRFEKMVDKGLRSYDTLKHWRTTKKKVESFLVHKYRAKDLALSKIEPNFGDNFYDYLTLEVKVPLAEPSAKKHIKNTKQIIKSGVKKKLIPVNPIEDFKCGGDDTQILPLELHQVDAIYNKDFGIDRLNEVRDSFVFQCFTGFAYQDIYGLTPENIVRVGAAKEKWLIKDRGKTGVSEMVPVLPIVNDLIKKYQNHSRCIINNRLMPIDSNARYNGYLKEIAVICGIKRNLNTHLARHTFADIMLNSGVPLEDVGKMLDHKNISTTQRYCRVRKERIRQSMQMAKNKLFSEEGELMLIA